MVVGYHHFRKHPFLSIWPRVSGFPCTSHLVGANFWDEAMAFDAFASSHCTVLSDATWQRLKLKSLGFYKVGSGQTSYKWSYGDQIRKGSKPQFTHLSFFKGYNSIYNDFTRPTL